MCGCWWWCGLQCERLEFLFKLLVDYILLFSFSKICVNNIKMAHIHNCKWAKELMKWKTQHSISGNDLFHFHNWSKLIDLSTMCFQYKCGAFALDVCSWECTHLPSRYKYSFFPMESIVVRSNEQQMCVCVWIKIITISHSIRSNLFALERDRYGSLSVFVWKSIWIGLRDRSKIHESN